ncbi:double-strand break repair helicase AddA [Micavibrio aeruginosavorus]|uniref:DNA 3'-5' helicase n=1 Tax=Micavibrio aeruginosavorus EPB TaxID=349215 RepID=M4VEN3_9BACT|nr:double-strand break repair helicase AddA [Micavibrio aeruginosavorus]AGH96955.1 ATP-dependent nuclease subunit A [Micavibrio aeruginosavorus EPB]
MNPKSSAIEKQDQSPQAASAHAASLQAQASDPAAHVWVGASAGSGKTKVLTDRVLRILLPRPGQGAASACAPHRILCLTFTKAAASEMRLRLSKRLGEWAVMDDDKLRATLRDLIGQNPDTDQMITARQLFARVVDAPGGLNITTIHAFCKSILGRFPLEAGLSPDFKTLEDDEAKRFTALARDQVLKTARDDMHGDLHHIVRRLTRILNEEQMDAQLSALLSERGALEQTMRDYPDATTLHRAVCDILDIDPALDADQLIANACADSSFAKNDLWAACRALNQGTKTDVDRAGALQDWLESPAQSRADKFDDYAGIFLTKAGTILARIATKGAKDADPACEPTLIAEAERLIALHETLRAIASARATSDLLSFGGAVLRDYAAIKARHSALDFDDQILRTLALLQGQTMGMDADTIAPWVMFKLDQGLDHILVDEAQDTNPEQWAIIRALSDDFLSGRGRDDSENLARTLFFVGDEKQSIYGFQRADRDGFQTMRKNFAARVRAMNASWWRDVGLNVSFRSTTSVLRATDETFAPPPVLQGVADDIITHTAHRIGQAGSVEIWPILNEPEKDKGKDDWVLPLERTSSVDARTQLAIRVADHIASSIGTTMLESKGRAMRAGDILVLVRNRNDFVPKLVRELKTRNVPVSGVDRMVLNDQLVVQDMMAVARFALLPEDDLSLACILKSPFCGWDDERLEHIAWNRGSQTLWSALRARAGDDPVIAWLNDRLRDGSLLRPYEFFTRLLQTSCPADAKSGHHALIARLGHEALDPLQEFINNTLSFERTHVPSLQDFVQVQDRTTTQLKREMDEAGDQVRIMTVHASKGLQAPVVILPDTIKGGGGKKDVPVLWPRKTGLPAPLWTTRKAEAPRPYTAAQARIDASDAEEERRLLYVAMTRAEDQLIIAAAKKKRARLEDSWYQLMADAFDRMDDVETIERTGFDDPIRRISNPQTRPVDEKPNTGYTYTNAVDPVAPDWVDRAAPAEPGAPTTLMPSRPDDAEPAARSPLQSDDPYRFRRGIVTHRLLQILPDMPINARMDAARQHVAKQDLPQTVRDGIVAEVMAILDDPQFAPLFAPGTMAEVPVTGYVDGQLISGQIDRLAITDDAVWIIDYKTNRPPPQDQKDVAPLYRKQMRAYAAIIRKIYPNQVIRTALLWTDGMRLMEILENQ